MNNVTRASLATLLALVALSGCRCGTQLNSRQPTIVVAPAALDFGRMQLDFQHSLKLTLANTGTVTLNVSELRIAPPFGVVAELPLLIEPDDSFELEVTFLPTQREVRESGALVVVSDDPDNFEVTVPLSGTGLDVVSVMPARLDFGEVYVGDSKSLSLSVTNLGTFTIRPDSVTLPQLDGLSGDLSALEPILAGGGTATGTVTFAPTQLGEIEGELLLAFPPQQGGPVSVPVTGKGIAALPQLCVREAGAQMERCTPVTATNTNGQGNLVLQLPPRCDIGVYPPDSGATACDEASATAQASLFVRNAGNTPFSYSLQFDRELASNPCNLPSPASPDFTFSGAPVLTDGGQATEWSEATQTLPMSAAAPPPFETAPVTVTYRATSRCPEDTTDQAYVFLSRQGTPERQPTSLSVVLQGSSRLPQLESVDWTCTANSTCGAVLNGVVNYGFAPAEVTALRVFQLRDTASGDLVCNAKLDAGFQEEDCALDGTDALETCRRFRWTTDGGSPAPRLPIFLDAGTVAPVPGKLGVLEFAWAGVGCGDLSSNLACPGADYCLYGVAETTDPYNRFVSFEIEGNATN